MSNLNVLRDEREVVAHEKKANDEEIQPLVRFLESVASDQEAAKVCHYLQEVEQITKLRVALNIRLARVEQLLLQSKVDREKVSINQCKQAIGHHFSGLTS